MGTQSQLALGRSADADPSSVRYQKDRSQQGFSTVAALVFVPFLLSAFLGLAALTYAFQRKLTAQSLCVSHGVRLQASLKNSLDKLISMNPQAARLRAARYKADVNLAKAVATGLAPVIAAAKAARTAVILQQLALKTKQQMILQEAKLTRLSFNRQLANENKIRQMGRPRAVLGEKDLAVVASPVNSLSPDYKPAPGFKEKQKQIFDFDVRLTPDFFKKATVNQKTRCSVTLEGENKKWSIKILVGSLWSKQPSSLPFLSSF